jgi:hypothetical protein
VRRLIPRLRGLRLLKIVFQLGAYLLVTWTHLNRLDLEDRFLSGLRGLLRLPLELVKLAATPGGGEA